MQRIPFIFSSLDEALRAGFFPFDRTPDGYIVRRRQPRGDLWELAIAKTSKLRISTDLSE